MAHSIDAIAAAGSESEQLLAQAFDARREQLAQQARQHAEQAAQDAPKVEAVAADTARPVASSGPTLSVELRSMLTEPAERSTQESASSSTALIGRLVDALRKYEQSS